MKINNKDFIKQFNQKIPIYELVISLNINLKKTGKNFMGLCPFHQEKTPSFSVSSEKNLALCMACRKGGSPLKFYQQFKNISIEQAIKELAKQFNLTLPTQFLTLQKNPIEQILQETKKYFQEALQYILNSSQITHPLKKYLFQERQLNNNLIEEFGLGYAHNHSNALTQYLLQKGFQIKDLLISGLVVQQESKDAYYDFFRHRVIFPLTNERGLLVGFAGRLIENQDNTPNKYLFNKETPLFRKRHLLYRFFEHIKQIQQNQEIILCEGFFDVISFYQVGWKNALALMGTELNLQQMKLLKSLSHHITIAYDGDSAGHTAAVKTAFNLNQNGFKVKILMFPANIDPDQYIRQNKQQNTLPPHLLQKIQRDYVFTQIEEALRKKQELNEIKNYINTLLKFQTKENQEYYKKEIYVKYRIDLYKFYPDQNILNNFNIRYFSIKHKRYLPKKNSLLSDNTYILREMHELINITTQKQEKYINKNEFYILVEICLDNTYIPFVRKDIMKYYFHPDILELIKTIEDYYIRFPDATSLDIDHFVEVYKDFLNNINPELNIYSLLLSIKHDPLFQKNKKMKNQEDLNISYLSLEVTHKQQQKKELQVEKQNLMENFFLIGAGNPMENFQNLSQKIRVIDLQIIKIEREIKNFLQKIKQLNYKIIDNF
ncbi:DNA primase [Candidatus Phytoplasma phoenicium]|uniref:DNA primase n=1 Tax=Candidatus Phytoplasma phoenicium TaxID=198422 RepID=A0A2S8NVC3_9MOLU|nr:DNA primase [Candidatus Phytoplasma phoenicium]